MAPNATLKNLKEIRKMLNFLLWREWMKDPESGSSFEQWKEKHGLPK